MLIVLLIIGGRRMSWKVIQGDEVAVIINNITGKITTIDHAGAIIYLPFIQDLYILDKGEQAALMISSNISAEYPQGNPVILKTRDGGDVSLDLVIQYRLISKIADKITQNTAQAKHLWKNGFRTMQRPYAGMNSGNWKLANFLMLKREDKRQRMRKNVRQAFKSTWYNVDISKLY